MATTKLSMEKPLRILILPEDVSTSARICTLAHPRTSSPCRYYFCPRKGVYEFTRIAAPRNACRSWLLGPRTRITVSETDQKKGSNAPETLPFGETENQELGISYGHVVKNPELLIATPIDPLFLILPAFITQSSRPTLKTLFLSVEDLLESLRDASKHLEHTLGQEYIRQSIEGRIVMVCDMVEAGDEKMYRLNMDKLLEELLSKARKTVASGLPASMEEKYIRKALELPTMAVKRESSLSEKAKPCQEEGMAESAPDYSESQSTATLQTLSTSGNIMIPDVEKENDLSHLHLLRLRTALSYMISTYLPPSFANALNITISSSESPVNFSPLEKRLAHIASLKAEALASRSLSDYSHKRNLNDDDEEESRAEKKRKKEEEEKRKKVGTSRGVRDLKKVDVSGMKKMSDFFGKPAMKK